MALAKAGHIVFVGIHERRGLSDLTLDSLMGVADEYVRRAALGCTAPGRYAARGSYTVDPILPFGTRSL
jgi:hypothetical protein